MFKEMLMLSSLLTFTFSVNATILDFNEAEIKFGGLSKSEAALPETPVTPLDDLLNKHNYGLCVFYTLRSNCDNKRNTSFSGEVDNLTYYSLRHNQHGEIIIDVCGLSDLLANTISSANQVADSAGVFYTTGIDVGYTGAGNLGYRYKLSSVEALPVPEPSSFALLSFGLLGLIASRRKTASSPDKY